MPLTDRPSDSNIAARFVREMAKQTRLRPVRKVSVSGPHFDNMEIHRRPRVVHIRAVPRHRKFARTPRNSRHRRHRRNRPIKDSRRICPVMLQPITRPKVPVAVIRVDRLVIQRRPTKLRRNSSVTQTPLHRRNLTRQLPNLTRNPRHTYALSTVKRTTEELFGAIDTATTRTQMFKSSQPTSDWIKISSPTTTLIGSANGVAATSMSLTSTSPPRRFNSPAATDLSADLERLDLSATVTARLSLPLRSVTIVRTMSRPSPAPRPSTSLAKSSPSIT